MYTFNFGFCGDVLYSVFNCFLLKLSSFVRNFLVCQAHGMIYKYHNTIGWNLVYRIVSLTHQKNLLCLR